MNPDNGLGPPERRSGPAGTYSDETAPNATTTTNEVATPHRTGESGVRVFTRRATPKPLPRICPTDMPGQLRARRQRAKRSVPLHCGCRDPWTCGHYSTEPHLSDNQLDGWVAAARHVLNQGQMPMIPLEVRRALWKRPALRELAELLHEGCGEVAS